MNTTIWEGPTITSTVLPNVINVPAISPSLLFDTASVTTPGVSKSVTYKLSLRTRANGVALMNVSLPSRTYPSQRYISVAEFNKATL